MPTIKISYYYNYFIKRPKLPKYVHIEVTNICNYKCRICARESMKRNKGVMDVKLYKQIIDEISELGIPRVRLQFYGEPLIHPNIIEMIDYAKQGGLYVDFDTNGYLLNEKIIKSLVDVNIDTIVISFHGPTKEQYISIHGKDGYNQVINSIDTMAEYIHRNKLPRPKIILQSTITEENYKEINDVLKIFDKKVDEFSITNCDYNPFLHKEDHRLYKFEYKRDLPCHPYFT